MVENVWEKYYKMQFYQGLRLKVLLGESLEGIEWIKICYELISE